VLGPYGWLAVPCASHAHQHPGRYIGEAVIARCRTTVELLAPRATISGLQMRMHQTTLYTSMFRVDDEMIVNFHIYGSPGRSNPVMVFARADEPRLWATLDRAFEQVWNSAKPLTTDPIRT